MKKKILCLVLSLLSLIPLLTLCIGAEETVTDPILRELSGFTIGGKPFNEADYPVDINNKRIELIALREKLDSRDGGAWIELYLYVPRAESMDISEVWMNHSESGDGTLIRYSTACDFNKDLRFARLGIYVDSKYLQGEKRFYNIDTICGYNLGEIYGETYSVEQKIGKQYVVTGSHQEKNVKYVEGGLLTMPLDLYGTVWRDENIKSKDTPYLYNEIATVYFTVPQDIYKQYDWIEQIKAEFYMFRSSPAIVTNSAKLNNLANVWAMSNGTLINSFHWDDLPTLSYGSVVYNSNSGGQYAGGIATAPEWIYNPTAKQRELYGKYTGMDGLGYAGYQHFLSYYFYDPDIVIDPDNNSFYQVASSVEIEEYITNYSEEKLGGNIQYYLCGLSSDLYDDFDYVQGIYNREDIYDYKLDSWQGDLPNFWQRLFDITPSGSGELTDSVKQFIAIEKPHEVAAKYAGNPLGLSNEYKIGKADCEAFLKHLREADGPVVLVRVAVNDYECRELDVEATRTNEKGKIEEVKIDDGTVWLARMNFYRDVDVTEVTFVRDGIPYTYKVVADPINMNGGLSVKNDPEVDTPFKDALAELRKRFDEFSNMLKITLGIIFVVIVVAVVVFVFWKNRRTKVVIKMDKRKR